MSPEKQLLSILGAPIDGLGKILRPYLESHIPPNISSFDLTTIYSALEEIAENFTQEPLEPEKQELLKHLDYTESRAAWHIIRACSSWEQADSETRKTIDQQILNLPDRQKAYLQHLYENPHRFDFFSPRERMLDQLINLHIVTRPEKYRIPLLEN